MPETKKQQYIPKHRALSHTQRLIWVDRYRGAFQEIGHELGYARQYVGMVFHGYRNNEEISRAIDALIESQKRRVA